MFLMVSLECTLSFVLLGGLRGRVGEHSWDLRRATRSVVRKRTMAHKHNATVCKSGGSA